jgi:hypothetical protein
MSENNIIKSRNPNRTQVGVPQRQIPKIEYNDKDIKAYEDLDLEVPETVGRWEKRFLSKVDISKGPIERSVIAMVRLKLQIIWLKRRIRVSYQSEKNSYIIKKCGKGKGGMVYH